MKNRINLYFTNASMAFSIAIVLLAACSPASEKQGVSLAPEDIKLISLSGEPVDLKSGEGKVIFVNFWATWCRPCLEEMPGIMRLRDQFKGEEIAFYFASDEEADRIQSFIARRKMEGNFVRVENQEAIGIQALPTTFIFDKKGKLVFSEMGFRTWDNEESAQLIKSYLNESE